MCADEPIGRAAPDLHRPPAAAQAWAEPGRCARATLSDTGATGPGDEAIDPSRERLELQKLEKETRLLDLQLAHYEGERRLNERHLRRQIAALRESAGAERLKSTIQLGASLLGVVLLFLVGSLLLDAVNARGLAVEPFRAPPDLAKSGLDGAALAERLLDRMRELQAETKSSRAESTYSNRWGENLKVEIPSTGISLGDVTRTLRERFGQELRITGDLYRTGEGLVLTVRSGAAPAKRFVSRNGDVEQLIRHGAEAVYADAQPYRYAIWLGDHQRGPESVQLLQKLAREGSAADRPWAYVGWAAALQMEGRYAEAVDKAQAALKLAPDFPMAWDAIGNNASPQGHDELLLSALKHERALLRKRSAVQEIDPRAITVLQAISAGDLAGLMGEYRLAAQRYAEAATLPDAFGLAGGAPDAEAESLAQAHDTKAALARLAAAGTLDGEAVRAARALAAQDAGDWAGAAEFWRTSDQEARTSAKRVDLGLRAGLVYALARSGRPDEAQALIAATLTDCYACLIARGQIAAEKGDRAGSDRWFGEAVRQGPFLHDAELRWGQALLARGDAEGARAKAQAARAKAPRDADVLALEAEALLRLGDRRGARARLKEAEALTPAWPKLRSLRRAAGG